MTKVTSQILYLHIFTNQDKQGFRLLIDETIFHQLFEQIQNHITLLVENQNLN